MTRARHQSIHFVSLPVDSVEEIVGVELRQAETSKRNEHPEPIVDRVVIADEQGDAVLDDAVLTIGIAAEDRADYHWDVPSVRQRQAAGESVFMSQFEADLYEALARQDGLKVVPQWPSRNKSIDLVVTTPLAVVSPSRPTAPSTMKTTPGA